MLKPSQKPKYVFQGLMCWLLGKGIAAGSRPHLTERPPALRLQERQSETRKSPTTLAAPPHLLMYSELLKQNYRLYRPGTASRVREHNDKAQCKCFFVFWVKFGIKPGVKPSPHRHAVLGQASEVRCCFTARIHSWKSEVSGIYRQLHNVEQFVT